VDWDSRQGIVPCFMMLLMAGFLATILLSKLWIAMIKHAALQQIALSVNGPLGLGATVTLHFKRGASAKFRLLQLLAVSAIMIWFNFWLAQPLSILHKHV